jgi:hypothetical protein
LFPAPTYETPGAPGKRWVQAEISQVNGVLTWWLNSEVVAQRTNTSPFLSGNIMLGYMDTFTSIANPGADNFVLFDNVRVLSVVDPPTITAQPTNRIVNTGTSTTFAVGTSGSAPLAFQWRFNGTNISGGTNSLFSIPNVQATNAGAYSVVVTNAAGSVTSTGATLAVTQIRVTGLATTNGTWELTVTGAPGLGYVIETSTNLTMWSALATLINSNGTLRYLLPVADSPQSFYRVTAPE